MRAKCNLPADHTEYPKTYKVLGIVGIGIKMRNGMKMASQK
jgi:hypothetical protein